VEYAAHERAHLLVKGSFQLLEPLPQRLATPLLLLLQVLLLEARLQPLHGIGHCSRL
jgi:hypothetical protein